MLINRTHITIFYGENSMADIYIYVADYLFLNAHKSINFSVRDVKDFWCLINKLDNNRMIKFGNRLKFISASDLFQL